MKTLPFALTCLVLVTLAACGSDNAGDRAPGGSSSGDNKAFDIRGEITQISAPMEGGVVSRGAIEVKGVIEDDTRYPRAAILLKETTRYLKRQGTETVPATFADLKVGTRVEVHFSGNVAGSNPAISDAGEVIIIE